MTKYVQKYPQNICGKWAKFQTKVQKYSKVDFVREIW